MKFLRSRPGGVRLPLALLLFITPGLGTAQAVEPVRNAYDSEHGPNALLTRWLVLISTPVSFQAVPDDAGQKQSDAEVSIESMGPEPRAMKLNAAVRRGEVEAVRSLLDKGLDVNAALDGLTPVQAARLRGDQEMVAFLVSCGADAKAPLPPRSPLVDRLFKRLIKTNVPGAAVLVAQNGEVLFEHGYGLASLEHQVPVTPETKFRIGSITKQFTASAILKLQEEGKLSVTNTLSQYLPDYPRGDEVTLRHLLTHTSGIHSCTSKPDFLKTVTVGVEPLEHIRSFMNDPYDFDPGQKWAYNNSGFFLLGYIIGKVSGQSYGEYLHRTLFEPLDLNDSGVHEPTAILPHEATGYSIENGRLIKALDWDMSRAGGAGALYSTVRDLYRWNEAIFNGKILSASSLKDAFTPVITAEDDASQPKETGYGYGWAIRTWRGLKEIGHGGGLNGFASYLFRLPKENFTVVVLANCAPAPPERDPGAVAHEVAELWLGDRLPPREKPMIDNSISISNLDAIVGRYDYGGAILEVRRRDHRMFAQLTGQEEYEIYPKSETNFFWKVTEAEVTFVKNQEGRVIQAIHRQDGQTIHASKLEDLEAVKLAPAVLDAVVGRYDYGGGKAIMTITRQGDRLFAQLTGQPRLEIFPKSETEFFWKAVAARISFVKDRGGKVVKAIHHQGGRTFEAPRLK
jgi:CubicO group peptidase (beta-lactamase class C family)